MSKSVRIFMTLGVLIMLCVPMYSSTSVAQESAGSATPEDVVEGSSAPRFVLVADDDKELGYFSDVEIAPGESAELQVAVMNIGDVPVSLRTYKVNALNSINGGFVTDEEASEPVGPTTWLTYPTVSLDLEPGEQRDIAFSVSVPEGTPPGQYISGLVVETAEPLPIDGTDSLNQLLGYSISVGVLVPGELVHSFELGVPDIAQGPVLTSLMVPVENTGNYLVRPSGELVLTDASGAVVLRSPVDMGSVYAGLSTALEVILPEQMQPGDYSVDLNLKDPESGATSTIEGAEVTVPEPVDPTGVSVVDASIAPNDEDIVFANVDVTLNNGGQQVPAANVVLEVTRDGEPVESVSLATNQVLLGGENQFTDRYIPAGMWEPGTYTFRIVVSAVDPNGGQETILLTEDLDAEIVVP